MNEQDATVLNDLRQLADSIQPDAAFVDALEHQLAQHSTPRPRRLWSFPARHLLTLAASLALVSVVFLVSPTLQSLAQDLLQYFERDDNDTFPVVPASQEAIDAPPDADLRADSISVAEAESQLGFDVLVPAKLPSGYSLIGAQLHAEQPFVSLIVAAPPGRALFFNQWRAGSALDVGQESWSKIAQSVTVHAVSINGAPGEYVEGGWAVFPGETEAQWLPDAPERRLRWQQGDMLFEIIAMGGSPASVGTAGYSYLGQAEIIALAEDMQ